MGEEGGAHTKSGPRQAKQTLQYQAVEMGLQGRDYGELERVPGRDTEETAVFRKISLPGEQYWLGGDCS